MDDSDRDASLSRPPLPLPKAMIHSAPNSDVLRESLVDAIRSTYEAERQLFEERTNERSVLFHIGRRLAADVETWGAGWVVDLEYNRQHLDSSPVSDPKRLRFLDGLANPHDEGRLRLPDLIVHKRSGATRDHNLLVLEAKHSPSDGDRSSDHGKLQAFRQQFCYRYAVFLEFPRGGTKPLWQWITDQDADLRDLQEVF